MSKLFPGTSTSSPQGIASINLGKRAALLSAGLLILWLAIQFTPKPRSATESMLFTDESGTVAVSEDQVPASGTAWLASGTGLMVVLLFALVGLSIYVYKKPAVRTKNSDVLQLISRLPLDGQQTLHLVQWHDEQLLLAATQERISVLSRSHIPTPPQQEKPDATENPSPVDKPDPKEKTSFGALLQTLSSQTGNGKQIHTDEDLPA